MYIEGNREFEASYKPFLDEHATEKHNLAIININIKKKLNKKYL
jgi:hypothetical protein